MGQLGGIIQPSVPSWESSYLCDNCTIQFKRSILLSSPPATTDIDPEGRIHWASCTQFHLSGCLSISTKENDLFPIFKHWELAIAYTCTLQMSQEEIWTQRQTHIEGRWYEGTKKVDGCKPTREDWNIAFSQEEPAWGHLNLRLLASRTIRQ